MLLNTKKDIEESKSLVSAYKNGKIPNMTPELWHAKLVLDSTIHPGEILYHLGNLIFVLLTR